MLQIDRIGHVITSTRDLTSRRGVSVLAELPRTYDFEHVGVLPHLLREGRKRRREADDTDRRVIEHRVPGRLENLHVLHRPVRADRDDHAQAAEELSFAGPGRMVVFAGRLTLPAP